MPVVLIHNDDGRGNQYSHTVRAECVYSDMDANTHTFNQIGYGSTFDEALIDFKEKTDMIISDIKSFMTNLNASNYTVKDE